MPACPAGCGRQIPPSKYLCNFDADRAGDLVIPIAVAFDAGNLLEVARLIALIPVSNG